MSNFEQIVNAIKLSNPENEISYVFYEKDTGSVVKVGNRSDPDSEYEILEVPRSDVESIVKGEKRTNEYKVDYDVSLKQLRLKLITYEDTHNSASTSMYQIPVVFTNIIQGLDCTELVDGKSVYVWNPSYSYSEGMLIWKDYSVFRLLKDLQQDEKLSKDNASLILNDVLVVKPAARCETKVLHFEPEYVGIFVDVWNNEDKHFAGQHVWVNGDVYVMRKDQEANTLFELNNAKVVVRRVKLMEDRNPNFESGSAINVSDLVLRNNYLYSVQYENVKKKSEQVLFYIDAETPVYFSNGTVKVGSLENFDRLDDTSFIKDPSSVLVGSAILVGKKIYRVEKSKDVVVRQNAVKNCWEVSLHRGIEESVADVKRLIDSTLYFSVTAKHDPNILYRSISFSLADLLSNSSYIVPFKYDFEFANADISIYTAKYFESYGHEIIQ